MSCTRKAPRSARLARRLGLSAAAAAALLDEARGARAAAGLPRTSMARLFLGFGVDMGNIVRWREEDIHPGDWLKADPLLDETLAALEPSYRLALLTNNPKKVGVEKPGSPGNPGPFRDGRGAGRQPRVQTFARAFP